MAEARDRGKSWYALLTGTGDELVQAVIETLRDFSFEKVIDVDKLAAEQGTAASKREDIQILDGSPILIVDVKGIGNKPSDEDALQADKHATMRLREWDRRDVFPLTIINHQRNLPPHDRDPHPYRVEIVKNAEERSLGLMTTWDIFRLRKNAERRGWPPAVVKPVFYRKGRIEPVPEHYRLVGEIAHVWKNGFGVITSAPLAVHDRLSIELVDDYEECVIASLQVDEVDAVSAPTGSKCGIRVASDLPRLREKLRVFKVVA